MRRVDREISAAEDIYNIIRHSDYGTLSLCDGEVPYAIPMSCVFFIENGEPYLCWHCANVGTKTEILHKNPHIVYSCVSECSRDFAPERLHWSFFYKSACVAGVAEEVIDPQEKNKMLCLLLKHFGEMSDFTFSEPMLGALSIWKCRLTTLTGKEHVK